MFTLRWSCVSSLYSDCLPFDRYSGQPSVKAEASAPTSLVTGFNSFLKSMEITFRRDSTSYRPRINKYQSIKDKEQKASGAFPPFS